MEVSKLCQHYPYNIYAHFTPTSFTLHMIQNMPTRSVIKMPIYQKHFMPTRSAYYLPLIVTTFMPTKFICRTKCYLDWQKVNIYRLLDRCNRLNKILCQSGSHIFANTCNIQIKKKAISTSTR